MKRALTDYRVFLQEFRHSFRSTGAILPSGPALCRALSSRVRERPGGKRILEVGPGTGAVTAHIVRSMSPTDRLDLVELNEKFVKRLRHRLAHDPAFQVAADRTRVIHAKVEELPQDEPYDVIISGLPMNNFTVAEVQRILDLLVRRLKTGGNLTFFEYIAVRKARALFGGREQRQRLRGIGQVLHRLLSEHEARSRPVWPNIPPAWVHHVKIRAC